MKLIYNLLRMLRSRLSFLFGNSYNFIGLLTIVTLCYFAGYVYHRSGSYNEVYHSHSTSISFNPDTHELRIVAQTNERKYLTLTTKQNPQKEEDHAIPTIPPYLSAPTTVHNLVKDPTILVIRNSMGSKEGKNIIAMLDALRLNYDIRYRWEDIDFLDHYGEGLYSLIIHENLDHFQHMQRYKKSKLNVYCINFNVKIIIFTSAKLSESATNEQDAFLSDVQDADSLRDYTIHDSSVLRMTKSGLVSGTVPGRNWVCFNVEAQEYEILAEASMVKAGSDNIQRCKTVVKDKSIHDGITKVFFGNSIAYWPHKLLFIDVMDDLTAGAVQMSLQRYRHIDVDF